MGTWVQDEEYVAWLASLPPVELSAHVEKMLRHRAGLPDPEPAPEPGPDPLLAAMLKPEPPSPPSPWDEFRDQWRGA